MYVERESVPFETDTKHKVLLKGEIESLSPPTMIKDFVATLSKLTL